MPQIQLLIAGVFLLFLLMGFAIGTFRERSHLRSLQRREAALSFMIVTDLRTVPDPATTGHAQLVMGQAVMATDYFKSIASQIKRLLGGEVRSLQSLIDRARREALLRALEQAHAMGASEVHNLRLETSNIRSANKNQQQAISVEMLAFGTAIVRSGPQ